MDNNTNSDIKNHKTEQDSETITTTKRITRTRSIQPTGTTTKHKTTAITVTEDLKSDTVTDKNDNLNVIMLPQLNTAPQQQGHSTHRISYTDSTTSFVRSHTPKQYAPAATQSNTTNSSEKSQPQRHYQVHAGDRGGYTKNQTTSHEKSTQFYHKVEHNDFTSDETQQNRTFTQENNRKNNTMTQRPSRQNNFSNPDYLRKMRDFYTKRSTQHCEHPFEKEEDLQYIYHYTILLQSFHITN